MRSDKLRTFLEKSYVDLAERKVYIYGIGNSMDLYQNGLKRINFKFDGYCVDSDFLKEGQMEYAGKAVEDINSLNSKEDCIVVFSFSVISANKMMKKASDLGFETYLLDRVVLALNKDRVLETYGLLEDEKSKEVYEEIIRCRVEGRYPKIGYWTDNSYFCWEEFTMKQLGTVFVDCGSYVGDTIESYIWKSEGSFRHIYGFEPDGDNYKSACHRKERLEKEWNIGGKLTIVNAGVGAETRKLKYTRNRDGLGTILSEYGEEEGEIYALDDYLEEQCDFIKADVESFEYDMLSGAKLVIKKYKPNLAICIYHNAVDLFSIAMYIKEIDNRYKFAVRHHSNTLSETVLYAWIEE